MSFLASILADGDVHALADDPGDELRTAWALLPTGQLVPARAVLEGAA